MPGWLWCRGGPRFPRGVGRRRGVREVASDGGRDFESCGWMCEQFTHPSCNWVVNSESQLEVNNIKGGGFVPDIDRARARRGPGGDARAYSSSSSTTRPRTPSWHAPRRRFPLKHPPQWLPRPKRRAARRERSARDLLMQQSTRRRRVAGDERHHHITNGAVRRWLRGQNPCGSR